MNAYPVGYDDRTDQLLDTDSLLLRYTGEFSKDALAKRLNVLDCRHSTIQRGLLEQSRGIRCCE